ncbi:MAG: DNA-binding protein [Thermoproteota archaeon]|nr:MAG: DNA-binding protein [Candidatus Korarchaeota archaeon]
MKKYVIDAGVLSLYFIGDERIKPYLGKVARGVDKAFICDVNLAEYYYKMCEKLGKSVAEIRYHQIRESPIEVVATNEELTRKAGEKKCKYRGKLSLADCFCLALAELKSAVILTTDRELAKVKEVSVKHFPV